ncbi:MAG: histidinol-phosphatase HisJ family protein [Clostridia bacterium]|nr:histidinol-phosphatase HisJ family protein [Clostridia bacterium]
MFDFHLHTTVSFDGEGTALEMAQAAANAGLREICFTDHWDDNRDTGYCTNIFSLEEYAHAYDNLEVPGLKIRRGVEFGLSATNQYLLEDLLKQRSFDFVIGSVHYVGPFDPYEAEFWNGRDMRGAFLSYLEQTLKCVQKQTNFDVLGHLTYVCKSPNSPTHEPLLRRDFEEITDEIMRILAKNGKGMEINTSGVDSAGVFLPSADYLKRFRELGGEIVTVGSDAHYPSRVGQYSKEALEILRDVFGYVCTFENRKPIFHKL